jgi:hypothetical protein
MAKTVAQAKRVRALLQNQPERQKRQEARVELRMRIRDQGIALTERMDHERTLNMRADTPLTARVAADMGAPPPPRRKRARPQQPPPPPPPPPPRVPHSRSRSPLPRAPPRARPPPARARPPSSNGSGNPMSTGSAAPMSTGSSIGSVARAYTIGTPRSVASTPSRPASRASTAQMSSRSPSAASAGSLVRRFNGLGYQGGAPPLAPARRERQLSRHLR